MMHRLSFLGVVLVGVMASGSAFALDSRQPPHEFHYTLYPPGGFSTKKSKAIPRPDPKQPKASPIIGKDGKFADFAQWFYDIGTDPKNFQAWWYGYFSDPAVWTPNQSPVFAGTTAGNQGHRIISWVGVLKKMVDADAEIDPAVKAPLCSAAWKRAAEQTIATTINDQGMLEHDGNKADMACLFHFLRTKWGAMGLQIENFYTLDRAQCLMVSLLTLPWVINEEDRYLTPPSQDYLEHLGIQLGGKSHDIRLVKDGKVLFTGGMFIGWKDKPALHGTWDGLAIINTLFKYYPDPDPQSPKSIFYKWNQLPEEQKQIGKKMIILCSRRLWLDWQENQGPTWCWVREGKPASDDLKPSAAPYLIAYDGYGDNQVAWAAQCWEEMFGNPARNTADGVQSLLAIAHGKIHRNLHTPIGQQIPGRYDFDPAIQKKQIEEDQKRLGLPADAAMPDSGDEPKLQPDPRGAAGSHE